MERLSRNPYNLTIIVQPVKLAVKSAGTIAYFARDISSIKINVTVCQQFETFIIIMAHKNNVISTISGMYDVSD